ncbi:MAG: hypothetical protein EBZ48_08345 [Proteobacteria bacterium]|nr:hypothetical protein [Pseudomonadota bacterium]
MININLLGDVPAPDKYRGLFLASWSAGILLVCVALMTLHHGSSARKAEIQSEVDALQRQLKTFKERTHSVADLKGSKGVLDEKLRIISLLKRSKSGPVRVMDDLNSAIPDRSWLTSIKESDGILRVAGFAIDNQTVAGFMRDLAKSDFFEKVDLVESKISSKDSVKLRQFSLDTTVRYGGKAKESAAETKVVPQNYKSREASQ